MILKDNVKYITLFSLISLLLIFITFQKYSPRNNLVKIKSSLEGCLTDTIIIVDKNSTRLCTKEHILNSVDYCFKNILQEYSK